MGQYLSCTSLWVYVLLFLVIAVIQISAFKSAKRPAWWLLHGLEIVICVSSFLLHVYFNKQGESPDSAITFVAFLVFGACAFVTMGLEIFAEIRDKAKEQ